MPAYTTLQAPRPAADAAAELTPVDRAERYEINLDKALALMECAERLPELTAERERWIERWGEFERRMDAGGKPKPGETAAFYVLVVALLGKRITQEERS